VTSEHAHRVHIPLHRAKARDHDDARVLKRAGEERRRRLRKALIDLAIVALLIIGASQLTSQLSGVGEALDRTDPEPLIGAVGLEILSEAGFVLGFLLVMDPQGELFSKRRVGREIAWTELGGGMLLPAGAAGGPGIAAWALHKLGMGGDVIAKRSFVLLFLNSAVDFAVVILFGVAMYFGVLSGSTDPLLTIVPAVLAFAAVVAVLLVPNVLLPLSRRWASGRPKLATGLQAVSGGVTGTVDEFRKHDWRLIGPVGYWAFDNAVLYVVLVAVGHPATVGVVVMGYVLGALGGSIPIPAGLGSIAGMAGMLIAFGVPAGPATSAVLIYQAISIGVAVIGGVVSSFFLRRTLKQAELVAASD
jgi:uncharacterized membrane protein YbhN (UPF0104 family)